VATFDLYETGYNTEGVPWDLLAAARQSTPVCPLRNGGYLLLRQDDVRTALKEIDVFRADLANGLVVLPEELFLSEIPEPRHGLVRRLYNAHLGPHRIGQLIPFVRDLCHELVDAILVAGTVDLVPGYSDPIPAKVVAQLIGVPQQDADAFITWGNTLRDRTVDRQSENEEGPAPIQAYVRELIARRRALEDPPPDVVTHLMTATVGGEALSETEICTQVQFIVLAGVETTRVLLGNLLYRLMMNPSLYHEVRTNRDLVPTLVEESLRHDAPVQTTPRRCLRRTVLNGVELHEGEWVLMGLGSANRDESVYADPDIFRLDRVDPRNHVAFGSGPHVCPGASLARMEATNAVNVFMDRVRELSPVDDFGYAPVPNLSLQSPQTLPANVRPA
jgi:cytochrome P450